MTRYWLVTNPRSGTADDAALDRIRATLAARNASEVGTTLFPDDTLPTPSRLDSQRADMLIVFAGDGTINAALAGARDWSGDVLILPGGTMNLLARRLHADTDPCRIIAAVAAGPIRKRLPFVEASAQRAHVGVILGPAAGWARVREAARDTAWRRMARAAGLAWHRSFGPGVRVEDAPDLRRRYQAMFVTPERGRLAVAAVDARDARALATLGWSWLTGDWLAARAVDAATTPRLRIAGTKPVPALFDGEALRLDPGMPLVAGETDAVFLTTRAATA